MWIKLTASHLSLAYRLMPWGLSWSLQPPPWHLKTAAVPRQGKCGVMPVPCRANCEEGLSHVCFPLLPDSQSLQKGPLENRIGKQQKTRSWVCAGWCSLTAEVRISSQLVLHPFSHLCPSQPLLPPWKSPDHLLGVSRVQPPKPIVSLLLRALQHPAQLGRGAAAAVVHGFGSWWAQQGPRWSQAEACRLFPSAERLGVTRLEHPWGLAMLSWV